MALFTETLVEEWLNRQGYFTIRGAKVGRSEIDLLAIALREPGALHVEVSVPIHPMAYITGSGAKARTPEQLEADVRDWTKKKYGDNETQDSGIIQLRETLAPGREWQYVFVHGPVRYEEELTLIAERGVNLVEIRKVLTQLRDRKHTPFVTSSEASDVAELLDYYC